MKSWYPEPPKCKHCGDSMCLRGGSLDSYYCPKLECNPEELRHPKDKFNSRMECYTAFANEQELRSRDSKLQTS